MLLNQDTLWVNPVVCINNWERTQLCMMSHACVPPEVGAAVSSGRIPIQPDSTRLLLILADLEALSRWTKVDSNLPENLLHPHIFDIQIPEPNLVVWDP